MIGMALVEGLKSTVEWTDPGTDPLADMRAARELYEQRADLEFRGLSPEEERATALLSRIDDLTS